MPPKDKKAVAEKLLEIKAQQRRQPGTGRWDLWSAFRDIELTQHFIEESLAAEGKRRESKWMVLNMLSQHLPITMVAAMESFFRNAVGELIDRGEPFAARAAVLIRSSHLTPDYPIFLAIQKRKFTIGQFISHVVPVTGLETINAALSTLLDGDFLQILKEEELSSKLWASERLSIRRIGDNPGPIFSSVERLVEIRNSIAHEIGFRGATIEEIVECCQMTKVFLIGAETHLFRLLHPGEPEFPSNYESKEFAAQQLRNAEDTLAKLFDEYKGYLSRDSEILGHKAVHDRVSELDAFQHRWKEFVKLKATVAANEYRGGTIWGLIYTRDLEASTLARIEELREKLDEQRRMKG